MARYQVASLPFFPVLHFQMSVLLEPQRILTFFKERLQRVIPDKNLYMFPIIIK
jgi:hypothetical protein